jgi:hypothetical protein
MMLAALCSELLTANAALQDQPRFTLLLDGCSPCIVFCMPPIPDGAGSYATSFLGDQMARGQYMRGCTMALELAAGLMGSRQLPTTADGLWSFCVDVSDVTLGTPSFMDGLMVSSGLSNLLMVRARILVCTQCMHARCLVGCRLCLTADVTGDPFKNKQQHCCSADKQTPARSGAHMLAGHDGPLHAGTAAQR